MKAARLGDNGNDEPDPIVRGIAGQVRMGAAGFRASVSRATRLSSVQAAGPARLGGATRERPPFWQDKDTPTQDTRLIP
jgi:hypothetical protein